jgi:hypothetical protein
MRESWFFTTTDPLIAHIYILVAICNLKQAAKIISLSLSNFNFLRSHCGEKKRDARNQSGTIATITHTHTHSMGKIARRRGHSNDSAWKTQPYDQTNMLPSLPNLEENRTG